MIPITKEESERVRERYRRAKIVRTCIQKSKRHRYYLPEDLKYLNLIADTNTQARDILNMQEKNQEMLHY